MNHFISLLTVALCCALAPSQSSGAQPEFDFVLRGGRVVDGTGRPAVWADVAVRNGRIEMIGSVPASLRAKQQYNVRGLIVAPGFIDVHTHAEGIEETPLAENFLRMGVTTLVMGNCGSSKLNIGEYYRQLETVTVSPNVCSLIGHGTVRSYAMGGSFRRPPSDQELTRMKTLVDQAMKDGAVGLSTGLIYLPGSFAETSEIVELAKIVASYDGIYASHIRHEGVDIVSALDELFRVARDAKVRTQLSHVKLSGRSMWGRAPEILERIATARREGLIITQDQYLYPASSTEIQSRVPNWAREGGANEFLDRLKSSTSKNRIVQEMKESLIKSGHPDFSFVTIASYKKDSTLNGKSIPEAASRLRGSASLDDQIEVILDMAANGGASGIFHGMHEDDLQTFLKDRQTMIASDSSVRKFGSGVPHPRGYGNSPRLLAHYVRDLKLFSLEEAIRRMTSLPAATFRLQNRGQLRAGAWADLVVFDPNRVQDHATFKEPHQYATGFRFVIVNGTVVVRDDQHTSARPGMILRHRK